jgi:hypothetical protein
MRAPSEGGRWLGRRLWLDLSLRRAVQVASVAVVAGVLATAGSAAVRGHDSPDEFAIRVVRLVVANRYADTWQLLARAEKKSVPVGVYVACERRSSIPGYLAAIRATRVQHVEFAVPGIAKRHPGYAVTLLTTISGLAGGASVTTRLVFRVIAEGSGYRWVLHQDRFNAYRHRHCLSPGPSA